MTGQDLHDYLKDALAALDVRWNQKHLVKVELTRNWIRFSYGAEEYVRRLTNAKK